MKKTREIELTPQEAFDEPSLTSTLYRKLKLPTAGGVFVNPLKRSIDARGRKVLVKVLVEIVPASEVSRTIPYVKEYPNVVRAKRVVVVGAGPAGLFAAIRLLELGVKPIIIERGKDVQARRRDIAAINKHHLVNPDSNYGFGEGGAGTYSDGKLTTRIKENGYVAKVLETFVKFGAPEEIIYQNKPHLGTDQLCQIIKNIRHKLETDFPSDVEHFNNLLYQTGYLDLEEYEQLNYLVASEKIFSVTENFPKICSENIPPGIERVAYNIKLNECAPFAASPDWMELT